MSEDEQMKAVSRGEYCERLLTTTPTKLSSWSLLSFHFSVSLSRSFLSWWFNSKSKGS